MKNGRMTNAEFAETDQEFKAACQAAGIPATRRQASKWKLKFGRAWKVARGTIDAPTAFNVSK